MFLSLGYDPENDRIFVLGRTDPPYEGDVRFYINSGDEAFGMNFDELKGLSTIEVDKEGKVLYTKDRPMVTAPTTDEIPNWLRRAK